MELYLKELEMDKLRKIEQKKKLKEELDLQIIDKKMREDKEKEILKQFHILEENERNLKEEIEKKKLEERKNILLKAKKEHENQLKEEMIRRKNNEKFEKEIDSKICQKALEEIIEEKNINHEKRKREYERFQKLLNEGEKAQERHKFLKEQEKLEDNFYQEQYTKLIEKQEESRKRERKMREEKWNKLSERMGNVNKSKEQKVSQDDLKMIKYFQDKEQIEIEENFKKEKKIMENKVNFKNF